jgi:hypothetical protein
MQNKNNHYTLNERDREALQIMLIEWSQFKLILKIVAIGVVVGVLMFILLMVIASAR